MTKAKRASEEEDVVLEFLKTRNRPFSVQNIVDSLQKAGIKKTAAERSLASLVEKKLVTKKEYGKAKIFIAAQELINIPSQEEVDELDAEIKKLQEELSSVSGQVDELSKNANRLRSELTLEEAKEKAAELNEAIEAKEKKIRSLGDGSTLMSKEDKQKLELSYYHARSLWKKYRRIVTDITDAVGEASGKKRSELFEELAIESDEAANVKLGDFPEIANPAKRQKPSPVSIQKRARV